MPHLEMLWGKKKSPPYSSQKVNGVYSGPRPVLHPSSNLKTQSRNMQEHVNGSGTKGALKLQFQFSLTNKFNQIIH